MKPVILKMTHLIVDLIFMIFISYWATKKNPPTFHYTGSFKGIFIMTYYNPYITR